MKFLLDENFPLSAADLIDECGHEAVRFDAVCSFGDDDFMSKCLENAPECIELMLRIILGKKDLVVVKSQTEYPIKSLQGRGVRFDVFARDAEGRKYDTT